MTSASEKLILGEPTLDNMVNKLRLLKYMYTSLYEISTNGGTFHRPLFWEFDDSESFKADHRTNFMLGRHLKVSLRQYRLQNNPNTTEFFFPKGTWCNVLFSNSSNQCIVSLGEGLNLTLPTNNVFPSYTHLRQGSIVAVQEPKKKTKYNDTVTTADQNQIPVMLYVNPDCNQTHCSANGSMYNDDGVGKGPAHQFHYYNFNF